MITKFIAEVLPAYHRPNPDAPYYTMQMAKPEHGETDRVPEVSVAVNGKGLLFHIFTKGPEEILELEAQFRAMADGIREFYRPEVKHDASTEI